MNRIELLERFDALVAILSVRLEDLGRDPRVALRTSRQHLKLTMVGASGTDAFGMYLDSVLQAAVPLEHVAEQLMLDWMAHLAEQSLPAS